MNTFKNFCEKSPSKINGFVHTIIVKIVLKPVEFFYIYYFFLFLFVCLFFFFSQKLEKNSNKLPGPFSQGGFQSKSLKKGKKSITYVF